MFEDPTDLVRCIQSDCESYRAGNTPFCPRHLRQQEVAAGATSIVEPELEAKVALVRTEDDDHPGQKKVWLDEERFEWVDDVPRLYVGPDPDTTFPAGDVTRMDLPLLLRRGATTPTVVDQHRGEMKVYNDDGTTEWVPDRSGCWVAHAGDWSALVLFDDELEALRLAVAKGWTVRRAGWGEELGSVLGATDG